MMLSGAMFVWRPWIPKRNTPYGLVEGHALIVREGKIRDIVPESSLYLTHDNTFDMQGRLVTLA